MSKQIPGERKGSLNKEVLDFLTKANEYEFPDIKMFIHTENEDIEILYPILLHFNKNYNSNVSDMVFVEFFFPTGDFINKIVKNNDKLEFTITIKQDNRIILDKRYKFFLINKLPDEDTGLYDLDPELLNKQDLHVVKGQCVDPLSLVLKSLYLKGSVYHKYNMEELLKKVLTYYLSNVTIFNSNLNFTLNITPPDNNTKYNNIIIKDFIKLVQLPHYLQYDLYGIYSDGIGFYFKSKNRRYDFYIYPLYTDKKFSSDVRLPKFILYNPEEHLLGLNSKTAYYDKKNLTYKYVVNDVATIDDLYKERYEVGTKIVSKNPFSVISDLGNRKSYYGIEDDKITYIGPNNPSSIYYNSRSYAYDKPIYSGFDYNIYKYTSNLSKYYSKLYRVDTFSLNPEIFIPGMSIKYIYKNNGSVMAKTGIIQQVNSVYYFDRKQTTTSFVFNIRERENW